MKRKTNINLKRTLSIISWVGTVNYFLRLGLGIIWSGILGTVSATILWFFLVVIFLGGGIVRKNGKRAYGQKFGR